MPTIFVFVIVSKQTKNGLLDVLRDEGYRVLEKTEEAEPGKFGYLMDPEGNKVELWEPSSGM